MIGGDLVEGLPTLFATPAVPANTMGSEVDVDTVPRLELLSTLFTTEWSL